MNALSFSSSIIAASFVPSRTFPVFRSRTSFLRNRRRLWLCAAVILKPPGFALSFSTNERTDAFSCSSCS